MPIFQLSQLSTLVWPFVLIVDLLAIVLALATATLLPILAVLVLTLVAMGAWVCRIPSELTGLLTALCLLGGFAIFFLLAATWASRRLVAGGTVKRAPSLFGNITDPANLSFQLPALSAAAALAGPLDFYLLYQLLRVAYPSGVPGSVPAAFALPSLLGLFALLKRAPLTSPARNAQMALFGGAALFFITLIFPIQFDRQWITVAWALEGAALCWLFHRVPHPGLRLAAIALLAVVFARLALNPAVLSYHPRAAFPILNWYLYTYGIATVCLFIAA